MASDRSLLEREMQRVELRPFTTEGFHRRRERKQRSRRIATAVVVLAVAAAAIGGLARAFLSGPETRPADQPSSRFLGTWTSTELLFDESAQTMTIRRAEDGALDITLHDDSSVRCSDRQTRTAGVDTPSTLTGTGRLEGPTTLVVPFPVLACVGVDGREKPGFSGFPEERGRTSYTLVLDPATDRLFDNLGVAWHRGATPQSWANPSTEAGVDGPGTFAMLHGEVTFRAPEGQPWVDHVEAYIDPRLFFLLGEPEFGLPDDAWIEILANPLPEASCAAPPGVPGSAEAVVRAIRSNPDLEATAPVAERVGGIDALRLDVAAVPGASACSGGGLPVVSVADREAWGDIDHGDRGRLYVLELPGGSARALAIMITAPEAAFDRAVEAAAPVVESFEFHTG
jgi:hypothetical protein